MWFRFLADAVLVLHLAFIVFVLVGGIAVLRWPRLAWVHVPAAAWGALIEFAGWICPLTPLENLLRERGGEAGFSGGFIDHYITGWIYPDGLTRPLQVGIGVLVLAINLYVYWVYVNRRLWKRRAHD
jgi:Protein of Unknown function (DUF2784)